MSPTPDRGTPLTPDVPLTLRHAAPVVTVVGDVLLDGWWHGRTERLAREAPAPVVEITERRFAPGGAANTAMNLAALGAQVRLVGLAGQDEPGHRLVALLQAAGVQTVGLSLRPGVRTVTKDRILSGDQVLVRLDEVAHRPRPEHGPEELAGLLAALLPGSDALVLCDYAPGSAVGGGWLAPVAAAVAQASRPPLLVVDAHDPAAYAGLAPDLVTPNGAEAARLLERPLPAGSARAAALARSADQLRARTGAATVVVTLDRDGTVTLPADGPVRQTSAAAVTDRQASGAGDTFVAALTMARAGGLELDGAVDFAQAAADVAVQQPGTTVCSTEDLVEYLGRYGDPALDADTLLARVGGHRAAGRRIVLTNGCFDVLHRGHTTYLAQAARLGDVLVVALNSDASVRRLKGPERPLNSAADRAGVLAALSCVHHVTVFDTDTPIPLLEALQPEVYVKGGDYTPEMLEEAAVVRAYGGEVRIVDYVPDHSTSAMVARIRTSAESVW